MFRQCLVFSLSTLCLLGSGVLASEPSPDLSPASASAPIAFSLRDAISSGIQNSPSLLKAEAKRSEGKWKGVEGFSVFLPILTLSGSHFFEKKYQLLDVPFGGRVQEIPQIFPSSSLTLDAKLLLFDGFQNIALFNAAQNFKDGTDASYQWTLFQAARDISIAYAKVVASKQLEEVGRQNLKTLENHLEQINRLKSGGLATHYDVLRVESQLSEAQADLLQAEDNTLIAQENLGRMMGLPDAVDVTESNLEVPSSSLVKDIQFNRNANKRQDLAALEKQVEASDALQTSYSRFWVPKIYLGAQISKYNNLTDPLSDWDRYRSSWNVGFLLNWEIFNPRVFAQSRQEWYKSVQTQKTLVEANLQAPLEFAFWKKRYLYSATLYHAKKIDADRATETVRLAQAGFKAGVRTTTEVLDAELELFRARAGIVNTQVNCLEAKEKLELSLGETL